MYLSTFDLTAITLAMVLSITLIVTTALQNARLHRQIINMRRAQRAKDLYEQQRSDTQFEKFWSN